MTYHRTIPDGTAVAGTVLDLAGLTYRQLDHWSREGLAHPLPRERTGTGHVRLYPFAEVQRLVLMARLTRAGMFPATAHDVAAEACRLLPLMGGPCSVVLGEGITLRLDVPGIVVTDGVVGVW
jgi:hypothetical protein